MDPNDDHAPCPRCGYENARCACPKNVPNPSSFSEAERRALAESVLRAVKEAETRRPANGKRRPGVCQQAR